MNLKNKKVTVVGLGKSGFAAAKFLAQKGAQVRATDRSDKKEVLENARKLEAAGVSVETKRHTASFVKGASLVVTSPGVPKSSLPLTLARKRKIPVIGEVELASFFCPGRVVAITGSNGKTTTSHLIHRLIREAGRKGVLCGNMGFPFLDAIHKIDKKTAVVLELSSFQLEDCRDFRPNIAVLLNIHPNHLDRYRDLSHYIRAKERIFRNQRAADYLILNFEDPLVRKAASKTRSKVIFFSKKPLPHGVFLKNGKIVVKNVGSKTRTFETKRLKLRGEHNLENILAAVAVAALLKIPKESIQKTLNSFETLEHRIEPVGKLKGAYFFNDSKSTTVESTQAAILSVTAPTVLIAGGRDKGADFGSVENLLERRVKMAVLYGEAREKIAKSWKTFRRFKKVERFEEAVKAAVVAAAPGDSVLLSPMCTSFDQFASFEHRGEAFKKILKDCLKQWKH